MKDKVFDSRAFDHLSENEWRWEFNLKDGLDQLRKEGLSTSMDYVSEITKSEDSFKNWVVQEQRKRLSGGFIPVAEREMVIQAYSDLYDRLNAKVQGIRSTMSAVVVKADGDSIAIDKDATEKRRRKDCTIAIDAEKAGAYYRVFMKLIHAHKELVQYEKDNGYYPESVALKFHDLTPFGWDYEHEGTVSEDRFAEMHRHKFTKK